MIRRLMTIALSVLGLAACDRAKTVPASNAAPSSRPTARIDDAAIIKVVATQLLVAESDLKPTTVLASFNTDELNYVEIIMRLEDQFHIAIPNERVMYDNGRFDTIKPTLTIHDLALIVQDCKDHPATNPARTQPQQPSRNP